MGDFFLKLLDWPFLLFIGIAFLVTKYKTEIGKVISRGGITLTWGDKSFEISELPSQLNENFAPITDDIDELKARIAELETVLLPANKEEKQPPTSELTEDQIEAARERMLNGLGSGQYTWRSLERLSKIGGVTTAQASNILRPMQEVVFSRGKSDRTLIKLSTK